MKDVKQYEIMAPAGSYESLSAAVRAGADAVYFGVEGLNMRSHSSNNFTLDDLKRIAEICSLSRVKSYLTVNTVIYDGDIPLMRRIIDTAKSAGVSAIIASDVAAMTYAREIGVEVHLSVQLNITNIESLKFYARFADVVVLARELNLDQVKHIHEEIVNQNVTGPSGKPLRLEMFCHGALCMAVSGKCYLSLHEHNASANRGECYQLCRRAYSVKDRDSDIELDIENEYIMSPKDLKTIHFLNKILDAGVSVLKIEGRARGSEYVKTVVECYREAVEAYCGGSFSETKIADWDNRLKKVFNRGFWNGYYLGQRLGEWNDKYGNKATEKKLYIGKVIKYFNKLGVAEFLVETGDISEGDKVLITGPTTGAQTFSASDIRVDLNTVPKAVKGERFSMKTPEKVRPSDKLYKLVSNEI
jgi:putative protease